MKRSRIKKFESLALPENIKERKVYNIVAKIVDGLLQLTVYRNNDVNPYCDSFIDKDGEDWINRIYHLSKTPTFSDTMFDNVCRDSWWIGYNLYGKEEIEILYPDKWNNDNYISIIGDWQQDFRTKKNDAKLKIKFDKWDDELSIIPKKVLPSFEKFMKKEASGEYFMFFENKESKVGYCSHCGKEVPLMKKPKQNDECRCSSCRVKAVFKRQNQVQTLETCQYDGAYVQKIDDKLIIRRFIGSQSYRGCDYKNPNTKFEETHRYILYKDGTISGYWLGFYNPRIYRWNKLNDEDAWITISRFSYSYSHIRNIYMKNMNQFLKNSSWKYWGKTKYDLIYYLIVEHQTDGLIEKLVKIGLFNIAKVLMCKEKKAFYAAINKDGKDLGQILKIDKARLKRLCQFDNESYYEWLKDEKAHDTIYDDTTIKNFINAGVSKYTISRLPKQMNYNQINSYILKQSKLSYEDYNQVLTTWTDYLQMAERNGWDINNSMIYKPKDLKEMHAKAILFRDGSQIEEEIKEIEKKWPKVNKNLAIMKPFEYENGEFSIVVPLSVEDIVIEGHSLQHCIHSVDIYFDRIEKRETYIFFLRKRNNLDVSWYTLEVEQNGNILQKRTTGDNQNKDLNIAIPFLKEFQKDFISKMSEEDKLLGIRAEENRKKWYKQYREEKRKINRNGKYAGKLLADVLEADLMIA